MFNDTFAQLQPMPDDPILGLNERFGLDPRRDKVNLSVGCYLDAAGRLPLLDVVREAENRLAARGLSHGYGPMSGLPAFTAAHQKLVFGDKSPALEAGRIAGVQTLGGTGALQLAARFAAKCLGVKKAVVSDPTWGNHIAILSGEGLEVGKYPYLNAARTGIDFDGMIAALEGLEAGTLVLMHACCHNPTGMDLTAQQWARVLEVVKNKDLLPLLDMAYQGFGSGLEEDAAGVRLFAESGVHVLAAASCSKNFALYGERIGSLSVVCSSKAEAQVVFSILKALVRSEYSNPPAHGALIVAEVLNDPALKARWTADVDEMRARISAMRRALYAAGREAGAELSFALSQNGMFSYTGLTPEEMDRLREEFGVYGVRNGRICVAALTEANVGSAAKAIAKILSERGRNG